MYTSYLYIYIYIYIIVYILICNGTHKYCTKQTTFQWHWSVIQSIIFFCEISWGDPWETPCNRNPNNSPWPVHSSGSFFALKRQHAFPRPHQEQSPETFPQGCQQSLPVNYDWDSTNVWVSVCIQSALSILAIHLHPRMRLNAFIIVACLHSEASLAASASSFEIVSEWIPQWALLENWVPVELVLVWSGFVPLTSLLEKSWKIQFLGYRILSWCLSNVTIFAFVSLHSTNWFKSCWVRQFQHEWREHGRYGWRSPQLPLWEHFPPASGWHVVTPRFGLGNNRGEARQSERL